MDALNMLSAEQFTATVMEIAERHRPSRMPFFRNVRDLPRENAKNPDFLGDVHLIYQAAMHATRAAVYYLPHLDNPAMRKRKLQIFVDDDGLAGGDTHHYQLTRAFQSIGAKIRLSDEEFGSHNELAKRLDRDTAHFIALSKTLYTRSLGPWCIIEVMSDDWIHALVNAFSGHFPAFANQPYFAECFADHVEERHAQESLDVTREVLQTHPQLLEGTLADARMMAEAMDGVWSTLDKLVKAAKSKRGYKSIIP